MPDPGYVVRCFNSDVIVRELHLKLGEAPPVVFRVLNDVDEDELDD